MEILGVVKGSIADELNIAAGDRLVSFNGYKVEDILDYEFYSYQDEFTMSVLSGGEVTEFEIEKYEDEDIGLILEREMEVKSCKNNCIFCFVNQLPQKEKLRNTLKVKDDDYRHSFISGNYVTLTNVSDDDLQRIIRLRLSPLYVSVHSAFAETRNKLLGVKCSPDIIMQLTRLKSAGIETHAQIVYCPEINEDYPETAEILSKLVKSLAIVPVGLTKNCNPMLVPVTHNHAKKVVETVDNLQKRMLKATGSRFVFAADEFYIKANAKIPPYETYEDFNQIENGIGLLAQFEHDFNYALTVVKDRRTTFEPLTIVTGVSAAEFIKAKAAILTQKFGVQLEVVAIKNNFFGDSVTVAGLVTGRDIVSAIGKAKTPIVIPRVMLKEFNDVFLDNMTLKQLSERIEAKVIVSPSDGEGFCRCILNDFIGEEI